MSGRDAGEAARQACRDAARARLRAHLAREAETLGPDEVAAGVLPELRRLADQLETEAGR